MLCLLAGCGAPAADAETVRTHFSELPECTAQIKIRADAGDSILEYELDYVYNRDDADTFTITSPASLAGVGGTITGTDNGSFTLQYDGMVLDDAMPQRTGLTPADALFCLLNDLRSAAPAQQWTEQGSKLLVLRYEADGEDGKIEKQVWLTENGCQPVYAELYAAGERVLTIEVLSYSET